MPNPIGTSSAAANAAPRAPSASKKRKSDAVEDKENLFPEDVEEIGDHDWRLNLTRSDTCNSVRRNIRNWIESGAMKVGEFQKEIGVSSKAYTSFMNRTGTWDGEGCDTYYKAFTFFKKRELQGLPLKLNKPKKAKTAADVKNAKEALDVSGVELPGEATGNFPIYDTCNEVRKKTRAFLGKEGINRTAFLREISKTFPDERKVSAANLQYFLGQKGALGGNTGTAFYAAYVFFEKLRIKNNKNKTKFREEMEDVHGPEGVNTRDGANTTHFTCSADTLPAIDKYGRFQFLRRHG